MTKDELLAAAYELQPKLQHWFAERINDLPKDDGLELVCLLAGGIQKWAAQWYYDEFGKAPMFGPKE